MIKSIKVWIDVQNNLLEYESVKSILTHKINNTHFIIEKIPNEAYKRNSNGEFSSSKLRAYLKDKTKEKLIIILTYRNIDKTLLNTDSILLKQVLTIDTERLAAQLIYVSYCVIKDKQNKSLTERIINNKIISVSSLKAFTNYSQYFAEEDTNILGRITYESLPSNIYALMTHGIRTHAEWSKPAKIILDKYDIDSGISKYGWVDTIKFAFILWIRKKYARELLTDIISARKSHPNTRLCICVHSYGSIVLTEALELASNLKIQLEIDSIILSGSILPTNYNWQKFISDENKFVSIERVLNICGSKDFWPVIANYFVRGDVGYSGTFGLNSAYKVTDIILDGKTHATILGSEEIEEIWVQFLKNGEIDEKKYDGKTSKFITHLDYVLKVIKYPVLIIFWIVVLYLINKLIVNMDAFISEFLGFLS